MGFNPHDVDDAIRNAGAVLAQMWKQPGQMPENNLHPDPSALQFRIKLMEDDIALIKKTLGDVVRILNGRK